MVYETHISFLHQTKNQNHYSKTIFNQLVHQQLIREDIVGIGIRGGIEGGGNIISRLLFLSLYAKNI